MNRRTFLKRGTALGLGAGLFIQVDGLWVPVKKNAFRYSSRTPEGVAERLTTDKGLGRERILKAQGLAKRHGVEWRQVLDCLMPQTRTVVEAV